MFEITVKRRFSAAHRLEGYIGQCSALHGHTWTVEVTVGGRRLDGCGMLLDFKALKEMVDGIIRQLDHTYLNELECFGPGGENNPTAENLAFLIFSRIGEELSRMAPGVAPLGVRVWESPEASAFYRGEQAT